MLGETTSVLRRKQPEPTLRSVHLPLDVVAEILCRLPVKQLIQLRCVCKSWNSLISGDSNFAKKHLRLSTSRHLILSSPSPDFLLLLFPISTFTSTTVQQFSYSIRSILNNRNHGIVASTCDGMVCFKIDNSSALLYNPSIAKFKILPPFKFPHQGLVQILYTLVHDRFTNTYKIFAANVLSTKVAVTVHTLGTDYWRNIQDYFPGPNLIPVSKPGIFVNDSVNWLIHAPPLVVSLDLEKESYQKLSLPLVIISFVTLGTLRGCLAILSQRDKFSDVWIMKEYGNENSWIKLFSVPPMGEPGFYRFNKALYISKDDKVLMECLMMGKYCLVVYDFINNTFKIPKFQNNIHGEIHCEMVAQEVYVESLISPF